MSYWNCDNLAANGGCSGSGFAIECDDGLVSDLANWSAKGADDAAGLETASYGDLCESTSGFYLEGSDGSSTKIWPSNAKTYAEFMAVPYAPYAEESYDVATARNLYSILKE